LARHPARRATSAIAAVGRDVTVKTAVAPTVVANAALAGRTDRPIRTALPLRIPGWTLRGYIPSQ
jgi:hypothetical protein